MHMLQRITSLSLCGVAAFSQLACRTAPPPHIQQALVHSQQLYSQNQSLAVAKDEAEMLAHGLMQEKETLDQQFAALNSELEVANQRLGNLMTERSELQERYRNLLVSAQNQTNPLSDNANQRFLDLQRKYPQFEFDPKTGVSKFHSDLLFSSGSATLRQSGVPVLDEFAEIIKSEDARHLNVLVVGHTDDRPIVKSGTQIQHPTNWHLSTNRANSVVLTLSRLGVQEHRMGAAGYSMFQPVDDNEDEVSRQRNRRVEIYILAPDAAVAGWDPGTITR